MFIDPVEEIHSHTTWKHIYPAYDLHTKKYFSKKKKKTENYQKCECIAMPYTYLLIQLDSSLLRTFLPDVSWIIFICSKYYKNKFNGSLVAAWTDTEISKTVLSKTTQKTCKLP